MTAARASSAWCARAAEHRRVSTPLGSPLLPIPDHHTPEAVRLRLEDGPDQGYVRDFIYGTIDGAVTIFAIAAGAVGANFSGGIVVVLGLANLFVDGFSMADSNYRGTRADHEARDEVRRYESDQIDLIPEGQREEVRPIYAAKGFEGPDLGRMVEVITADRDRWLNTMPQEKHRLQLQGPEPIPAAAATFATFLVVGAIPLLPFFVDELTDGAADSPFLWSTVLTAAAFVAVGAAKGDTRNPHLALGD